jgi:hypothetical protein
VDLVVPITGLGRCGLQNGTILPGSRPAIADGEA